LLRGIGQSAVAGEQRSFEYPAFEQGADGTGVPLHKHFDERFETLTHGACGVFFALQQQHITRTGTNFVGEL
jgi:hypothetical protein